MEEELMIDTITTARPRVATPRPPTTELARAEARRMLRHPAPWLGIVLSVWWLQGVVDEDWASSRYQGLVSAFGPLLLGISMAAVTTFCRGRAPVAEDAPVGSGARATARLLGGLPLVGLVAVIVAAGTAYHRATGGVRLGDEPGLTMHAHHSFPELLQPVLLAGFAVAIGAAVVQLVRSQVAAQVLMFVFWFLVAGTYWLFQGPVAQALTPLAVQPNLVEVAPAETDPTTLPSDWLLSAPSEYQDHWARLVVSPELAAWHDVYLVALTALLVAAVTPGRWRRALLLTGALVAAGAVAMQLVTAP
jgi:hypothetical protein